MRILEAPQGRESLEDHTFFEIDLAPQEHAIAAARLLRTAPCLKILKFAVCHVYDILELRWELDERDRKRLSGNRRKSTLAHRYSTRGVSRLEGGVSR